MANYVDPLKEQSGKVQLANLLTEYKEKNIGNLYPPVAVGKYGIRRRDEIYSKDLAKDYSKNKLIYKNTLTLGMGSKQIDIGILDTDDIYSVSPAYRTFKIHNVYPKYLRHCLGQRNSDMFNRFAVKSCRQGKSVDVSEWLTYEIPIYSFEIQCAMAENLDLILEQIEVTKRYANKLDDLVKSRFVEMFGEPDTNPLSFDTMPGSKLFRLGNGKAKPQAERFEEGVPAYGGNGISWYTSEVLVDHPTIVIGRVGRHCGNTRLVEEFCWVTDNAMFIKDFKRDCFDMTYLITLMEIIDFNRFADAGDLWKITQKPFMEYQYPVPPLALQQEFAAFVQQVDKSKFAF